jgi:hypothetical protein
VALVEVPERNKIGDRTPRHYGVWVRPLKQKGIVWLKARPRTGRTSPTRRAFGERVLAQIGFADGRIV